MRKKNVSFQPLTKADLESALEKYPTKEDLRIEIKLNTDEVLAKVDENAQKYRDQILTSNDKLAKQLETMREEFEIGNFQTEEKIKDHEERIKILEKIQQTL